MCKGFTTLKTIQKGGNHFCVLLHFYNKVFLRGPVLHPIPVLLKRNPFHQLCLQHCASDDPKMTGGPNKTFFSIFYHWVTRIENISDGSFMFFQNSSSGSLEGVKNSIKNFVFFCRFFYEQFNEGKLFSLYLTPSYSLAPCSA